MPAPFFLLKSCFLPERFGMFRYCFSRGDTQSFVLMARKFYVSLSHNPGPFVENDGSEKGVIVAEVDDLGEPPKASEFAMAASEFQLGSPRISEVLPFLDTIDLIDARMTAIGNRKFWTKSNANSLR